MQQWWVKVGAVAGDMAHACVPAKFVQVCTCIRVETPRRSNFIAFSIPLSSGGSGVDANLIKVGHISLVCVGVPKL